MLPGQCVNNFLVYTMPLKNIDCSYIINRGVFKNFY